MHIFSQKIFKPHSLGKSLHAIPMSDKTVAAKITDQTI